ncbi:hypothetical protein XELAEV_18033252mg [Xenopus laevis]|uniref:C3H1-type domain-containing protein n=1 Tax=Xenopus laevis TaxID=8355 RepID=A0A974CLB5_XENLA|nr:hypothetical protein XELAEV_18033252mg [Xenopus laevis]
MLSRFASAASARELSSDELLHWINCEKGRGAILEAFNQCQREEVNVDACPSEESEEPAETPPSPQPTQNPPTAAASSSLRATTRGKKGSHLPNHAGTSARRLRGKPRPPQCLRTQQNLHLRSLAPPTAPIGQLRHTLQPLIITRRRHITALSTLHGLSARSGLRIKISPDISAPICAPQLHLPTHTAPQPTSTSSRAESHVLQDLGKLDDILPGLKDLVQKHLVAYSPGATTRQIGTGVSESSFRDAFSCEVTPIGLHLSSSVREKIVRGDNIDLLSLLPSSKEFYKNEKRGDNEEDGRRPVAGTFSNWLQAFCIYANILMEKHPEIAPGLFKHVDMILFRQKMAINKMLKWGVKDIDLWMGMLLPKPQPPQFVNKTQTSQQRYNCYWAFNESICKLQTSCRFKHECAVCNGSHPAFRCLKRFLPNAGRGKEQHNKADNTSEGGKNARYLHAPGTSSRGKGNQLPTSSMGIDLENLKTTISSYIAKKSWSSYINSWSLWSRHVIVNSNNSELDIHLLNQMQAHGKSPNTMKKHIAGISFFLKLFDRPDITKKPIVKQLLKGYQKAKPTADKRKPITLAILLHLIRNLRQMCTSEYEYVVIHCVIFWSFKTLDRCRKKINSAIAKFAKGLNVFTYRHTDLELTGSGLYRDDSVHLSDIGLDIFNNGLRNAIELAISKWKGAKAGR